MSAAAGSPKSPSRGDKIAPRKGHTHAVFTFGRFQPPTLGHRVLAKAVADIAGADADPYIFVSSTQDAVKNPLDVHTKVSWMKYMFRDIPVRIINTTVCECKGVLQVVSKLRAAGYSKLTMVIGSDRADDFSFLKGVEFVAAGDARNESHENLSGMSGTKMRAAAVAASEGKMGGLERFMAGTGLSEPYARYLIGQIVDGMRTAAPTRKSAAKAKLRRVSRRNK